MSWLPFNIYRFASPQAFYPLAGKLIPWFWALAAVFGIAGLYVGFLVAPTDGAGLRAALADLLGDAATRARLGAAARQWVEANGSVAVMRDRYDAFYARAMARR